MERHAGSLWGSLRDLVLSELASLTSSLHPMLPGSSRVYLPLPPSELIFSAPPFTLHCGFVLCSVLLSWYPPNSTSQLALSSECQTMAQPVCLTLLHKIADIGKDSICAGILG